MYKSKAGFCWSLLIIALLSCSMISAQDVNLLPENTVLSYNGKFIHPVPKGYKAVSGNGQYFASYEIEGVSDETRLLRNLEVLDNRSLKYILGDVPGSEIELSNSGFLVVYDMTRHFAQEITLHFFNTEGVKLFSRMIRNASLFGFSPSGNLFVAGTDENLHVFDLKSGDVHQVAPGSRFAFTADEQYLATARESSVRVYSNFELIHTFETGFFYPRGIAISDNQTIAVIDKQTIKVYSIAENREIFMKELTGHYSYRDIMYQKNSFLAGVHYRYNGLSSGILQCIDDSGSFIEEKEMAAKTYQVFESSPERTSTGKDYDPIPWPFVPFDQVHKVWNHYEQHMGDGSGTWAYLHQGLDLEVPINEPTYAVEAGWVKLVLTIGGESYWRVAVSPEQVSGYSNGWLYAHLVQSSIQVDVGDYVMVHDYLGDIIDWSGTWGHIHFVNIRDHGDVWYYDDDTWGINFNPLLALDPNTDEYVPVIENFSGTSKFGYCENETSVYLDPDDLHGDIDIIAKISDYHGDSEWEQPAFITYYWINKIPEDTNIFPKTLGQILNHTYTQYPSNYYEAYAPLLYKKDWTHPSPSWNNFNRDYWHILTNNNGDSLVDPSETELAFPTADYYDGNYRIFVEAWDEYGNMTSDSQDVVFNNGVTLVDKNKEVEPEISVFPNPAGAFVNIGLVMPGQLCYPVKIRLFDAQLNQISELDMNPGSDSRRIDLSEQLPGMYFVGIRCGDFSSMEKFVKF